MRLYKLLLAIKPRKIKANIFCRNQGNRQLFLSEEEVCHKDGSNRAYNVGK